MYFPESYFLLGVSRATEAALARQRALAKLQQVSNVGSPLTSTASDCKQEFKSWPDDSLAVVEPPPQEPVCYPQQNQSGSGFSGNIAALLEESEGAPIRNLSTEPFESNHASTGNSQAPASGGLSTKKSNEPPSLFFHEDALSSCSGPMKNHSDSPTKPHTAPSSLSSKSVKLNPITSVGAKKGASIKMKKVRKRSAEEAIETFVAEAKKAQQTGVDSSNDENSDEESAEGPRSDPESEASQGPSLLTLMEGISQVLDDRWALVDPYTQSWDQLTPGIPPQITFSSRSELQSILGAGEATPLTFRLLSKEEVILLLDGRGSAGAEQMSKVLPLALAQSPNFRVARFATQGAYAVRVNDRTRRDLQLLRESAGERKQDYSRALKRDFDSPRLFYLCANDV